MLKQLFDDVDVCPQCKNARAFITDFKMYYTACCGSAYCHHCVDVRFSGGKKKVQCDALITNALGERVECGSDLKKSDFNLKNLQEQKYDLGNTARKEFEAYTMRLRDFDGNEREFNDYLEKVQDIQYDLVYGSSAERRMAQQRKKQHFQWVRDYRKKNVDKLNRFEAEDRGASFANRKRKEPDNGGLAEAEVSRPAVALPQWEGPKVKSTEFVDWKALDREMDAKVAAMPHGVERKKREREVKYAKVERVKQKLAAGGFLMTTHGKRAKSESWGALAL